MLMQPTAGPLTVDDFHRLGTLGVYGEDDRVELIHGRVVPMTPIGPRHAGCVRRLLAAFAPLAGRATLDAQDPVTLDAHEEPQPDIALLRYRRDGYATSHPQPDDILLLIEVADSSVPSDRDVKIPTYAATGITEVWLVDLPRNEVSLCRQPVNGTYRDIRTAHRGDTIAPLAFPELTLAVSEILG